MGGNVNRTVTSLPDMGCNINRATTPPFLVLNHLCRLCGIMSR